MNTKNDIFTGFERLTMATGVLLITMILFVNTFLRYIFHVSFSWGDELSRYINMWIVFIGVSAGVREGAHIGISAFVDFCFKGKAKNYVSIISDIISIVFCILISYYGYQLTIKQFQMKQMSPALGWPIGIVYASIPFGMIISVIRYIQKITFQVKMINNK
ncbi:MAG: C4-dicarboxylate transporter, DctQ subunit [Thermoanaerobacteraceae bacterium]|nr:C4-dicarboxylate transporter, DctQ subunit [Thermoanaerobacteraceae bacterium]